MGTDEDELFQNKLDELKNLVIQSDGAVAGKDFREVILRQMQMTHALFERQHQDVLKQMELNTSFFQRQHEDVDKMHISVKEFVVSSKRVEKLTFALIGLTGVLAAMTYLLIPR